METDTATVVAETIVVEIVSEILALAAQTMPMTGGAPLRLQHVMTEVVSVVIDTDLEEVIDTAVAIDTVTETDMAAETDMAVATDTVGATDMATETEAMAVTEIVDMAIEAAMEIATEIEEAMAIETVATDGTIETEDTEVDSPVQLTKTTSGEEQNQKFQIGVIQETKLDEMHHENVQNCNYPNDLLMKNQERNRQARGLPYSALQNLSM